MLDMDSNVDELQKTRCLAVEAVHAPIEIFGHMCTAGKLGEGFQVFMLIRKL